MGERERERERVDRKGIAGINGEVSRKRELENPAGSTDNIRRDLEDGGKGRCHGSRRHVIRYFCQENDIRQIASVLYTVAPSQIKQYSALDITLPLILSLAGTALPFLSGSRRRERRTLRQRQHRPFASCPFAPVDRSRDLLIAYSLWMLCGGYRSPIARSA
jgi:hypothetical protein